MGKIRIAIIDSGVNIFHPALRGLPPSLYKGLGCLDEMASYYGHGTAVFYILAQLGDMVEITSYRIPNIENGAPEMELIDLLREIRDNHSFDIINLSLGISLCDKKRELYAVCKEIDDSGTVIISAFDNDGSMTFPAAFDNVIGVVSGASCRTKNDYEYYDDTIINIGAFGKTQRLPWNNPDYILLGGNSFACAHTTCLTAKLIDKGYKGRTAILSAFQREAKSVFRLNRNQHRLTQGIPFGISRAALFPFNKEMHSLVRFSDMLPFDIAGIYDVRFSANVGGRTDQLLKNNKNSYLIQDVAGVNWDTFDTLILGHMDELMQVINDSLLREKLVATALHMGKHVVSFDKIEERDKERIYWPSVSLDEVPPFRLGKLYRNNRPVLGVFGTSAKQGKYTLQIEIRKRLQSMGYMIGQIGTEPTALLFGMDYVFPMGYNSAVGINGANTICYLNWLMEQLSNKGCDIIIVGSQSGSVLYDTGNINQYPLTQYEFLLGTLPDIVVLCINTYDEIEYINRTISFLESTVECRVIGVAFLPLEFLNEGKSVYPQQVLMNEKEVSAYKKMIENDLNLPAYCIGIEQDMDSLLIRIIDCFTDEGESVDP